MGNARGSPCPRALIFKPSAIEWQCFRAGHRYQGNIPREVLTADATRTDNNDPTQTSHSKARAGIRSEIWELLIEDYGERNLSLSEDKFPAMEGIARQLNITCCDTYLAELWQSNILRQLAWHPKKPRSGNRRRSIHIRSGRPSEYRAPSWSWACMDGKVQFLETLEDFIADVEFKSYEISPVIQSAPMVQVQHAELRIRATSIASRDTVLTDLNWRWEWTLDDDSRGLNHQDPVSARAFYMLLGYVVRRSSGRQAVGLVFVPSEGDTFRRIGMFVISQTGHMRSLWVLSHANLAAKFSVGFSGFQNF